MASMVSSGLATTSKPPKAKFISGYPAEAIAIASTYLAPHFSVEHQLQTPKSLSWRSAWGSQPRLATGDAGEGCKILPV